VTVLDDRGNNLRVFLAMKVGELVQTLDNLAANGGYLSLLLMHVGSTLKPH
jgi:hypothetical protein